MNGWNTITRFLVGGVVAVGLLVVPQTALAIPGHCCLVTGGCVTIYYGDSCANYNCVSCESKPCDYPSVQCFYPIASEEPDGGTGNEAVSSPAAPEADASEGEVKAESGTAAIRGAVGPASTDAALVDPAAAMDVDAETGIGDAVADSDSPTPPDAAFIPACANICSSPAQGCARLSCEPCCWLCGGYEICILPPPPGP